MSVLGAARPAIIICTRDRARATLFYRDVLGLPLIAEDQFAAIFRLGGAELRISHIADFVPHEHTILGFKVADVETTVNGLREHGVVFNIYPNFKQDELGILRLPNGIRVAWFKDPDGNVLSVTDA